MTTGNNESKLNLSPTVGERYVTNRLTGGFFIYKPLNWGFCVSGASMTELQKAKHAFSTHKAHAKLRGIEFKLTFDEWWDIWKPHFHNRGRGKHQFVMCRTLDKGAYEVGNVRIDTPSGNGSTRAVVNFSKKMAIVQENNKVVIDDDYADSEEESWESDWIPKELNGYSKFSAFD